jgi:hypothetical protein
MPTMTERAAERLRRMPSAPDLQKRQRLQALSGVARGPTRHRHDVAAALGGPRHRVAAGLTAYAQGGIEHALSDHVPRPTRPRRITATARTALPARWPTPTGVPSDGHLRTWSAAPPQVPSSYPRVYARVRGARRAKPKRPRPSHETNGRRSCPQSPPPCPPRSPSSAGGVARASPCQSSRRTTPGSACRPSPAGG